MKPDNIDFEGANEKLKDFYEKAKEFTKEVGTKISKQAAIQKSNLDLLKLQEELARAYRELGEKSFTYFNKKSPADEKIKELVTNIKSLNAGTKKLKLKISKQKKA